MKAKYTVIPSSRVDSQLLRHTRFISRVSISAARRFRDEFAKVLDALEQNTANGKKEMINGVLYINRNGKRFNLQGQEVK